MKVISKHVMANKASREKVQREVSIWGRLAHPNIIRLYETFESDKHFLYIEELCAGGDLLTYVRKRRRLSESVARAVLWQIMAALQYCHRRNIVHRDIKLDNVLLTAEGAVKVCDFGVSRVATPGERLSEKCGTPAYLAPETIVGGENCDGFAADVWSAGIVLYAMIYGTVPFKAKSVEELSQLIIGGKPELHDDVSPEARDLIQHMLDKDPRRRSSIIQVLVHPWFGNGDDPAAGVRLFTKEESQRVAEEFSYPTDGRDEDELADEEDKFVEQDIDESQSELTKNATTKSDVFAPFNTTMTVQCDVMETADHPLLEKGHVLRLGPQTREADAQYERNNNGQVDNGVYNAGEKSPAPSKPETEVSLKAAPEPKKSVVGIHTLTERKE